MSDDDFVTDQEFDVLVHVGFSNIARVLVTGLASTFEGLRRHRQLSAFLKKRAIHFSQLNVYDKQDPVLTRKDRWLAVWGGSGSLGDRGEGV